MIKVKKYKVQAIYNDRKTFAFYILYTHEDSSSINELSIFSEYQALRFMYTENCFQTLNDNAGSLEMA